MALRQLLSSPIGKKLGMAVSGLILYAFLVGHLHDAALEGSRGVPRDVQHSDHWAVTR